MKLFAAKITWYNGYCFTQNSVVIAAETFTSANEQITDIIGNENLKTIDLTLINPDRAFAFINEATYQGLLEAEV